MNARKAENKSQFVHRHWDFHKKNNVLSKYKVPCPVMSLHM